MSAYHDYDCSGIWEMFSRRSLIVRARTEKEAKKRFRNAFKRGSVTNVSASRRAVSIPVNS